MFSLPHGRRSTPPRLPKHSKKPPVPKVHSCARQRIERSSTRMTRLRLLPALAVLVAWLSNQAEHAISRQRNEARRVQWRAEKQRDPIGGGPGSRNRSSVAHQPVATRQAPCPRCFLMAKCSPCAQVSRAGKIAAANTSYGPLGI